MNPISRALLSTSLAKRAAAVFLTKKGPPLYIACVLHSEAVHDKDVFAKLKEFAENLPFRPTLCVMTPRNPYVKWGMERRKVSGDEFTARISELSGKYDIGLHGHWCRPAPEGAAVKLFKAGEPTPLEDAGFELTMNEPEAVKKQFQDEYEYLSANFGRPTAYSAGWWYLNDTVSRLLETNHFETDCSIRHGYRDTFGGEYLPQTSLPAKGVPFILPPTRAVTEFPSVFYLHMNWWTLVRELFPLFTASRGPLFAVIPTHDYNLKEDCAKVLENIRLLSGIGNVHFVSLPEMKRLAETSGTVAGAPGLPGEELAP